MFQMQQNMEKEKTRASGSRGRGGKEELLRHAGE
jgi:hypothetical protein